MNSENGKSRVTEESTRRGDESSVVAERALDVLLCFLDAEGELGVSEIGRRLGIDKGRVHRFLMALKRKGLVADNPRTHRYHLGFRVLHLSHALTRQVDVVAEAQPFLRELRDATSETAALSVRVDDHRIHLAQAEADHEVRQNFQIGKPLPMHVGAPGKVLLAFAPPEELDRLMALQFKPSAYGAPVQAESLSQELLRVRQQGYAITVGERMVGSRAVAVPAWSWRGDVMVLVVSGPAFRFTAERANAAVPILREVSGRFTRRLGGEPFATL